MDLKLRSDFVEEGSRKRIKGKGEFSEATIRLDRTAAGFVNSTAYARVMLYRLRFSRTHTPTSPPRKAIGLLDQALLALGVGHLVGRQHLDRYKAIELLIAGL